jgi:hypothetical protein
MCGADRRFDRAEAQSLHLALRAAQLGRRIDLDPDAVAGGLLQLRLVDLDVLVLHVIDGLRRKLHDEVLRLRASGGWHETAGERERDNDCATLRQ